MYPVSGAFLQAVQENTRRYYWTGKITTKNGTEYSFGAEDIVKGSGYISSQCCGSTEIELGTVYSSEMGITLLSAIDRYSLEGARVELTYHLRVSKVRNLIAFAAGMDPVVDSADASVREPVDDPAEDSADSSRKSPVDVEDYVWTVEDDGIYEAIPMGIFEVSEANRTVKCLELKAYDYMLRFEKSFNGFETVGKAYDFIHLCCEACQVEFSQSQEEIEAMPNGKEMLSIYTDNDIETYRDVLHYVGQVLGGFFFVNRIGQLELKKFRNTPVMTVDRRHRFSSSFSDFITRYTAVSSTNLRTQIAEYYAQEKDDGLTMNLGVNPLLQFGLEETRRQLCENILEDLSEICYVPFDSDTIGNPALDVGDVLTFSGGQADEKSISLITSMQVKLYGKQKLKGVGKNPRLSLAKSKNEKNISGLLSQIEAGKIGIHTFTNASGFTVGDQDTKIISMEFAMSEENQAQFLGQVIVDVKADEVIRTATASGNVTIPAVKGITETNVLNASTDPGTDAVETSEEQTVAVSLPVSWKEDGYADVIFSMELNNQRIPLFVPQERWRSGRHTILLYYPLEKVLARFSNSFRVYMRCEGGSATVDTGGCIASISGQGLGADAAWDGKIEEEDFTTKFQIGTGKLDGRLRGRGMREEAICGTRKLVKKSYSDTTRERSRIGGFAKMVDVSGSNS